MFGRLFSTAAADDFADSIVAEVKRELPPGLTPGTKNFADRVEKLNAFIAKRTGDFARSTARLGIYKKARLLARVRDGMSVHGYAEPFVKSFSYDLLNRLMAASSDRKR